VSAALVALAVHVPAEVKVTRPAELTEHPAVPLVTRAKVTAPVPLPPEVLKLKLFGYVPVVFVTVSVA
jgi:hypothetical protein